MLLDADGGDGGQQEERRGRLAERQGGVICNIVKHVVAAADNKENYRNVHKVNQLFIYIILT